MTNLNKIRPAIAFALLGVAGAFLATMPDDQLPSLAWRAHFGIAELLIGLSAGMFLAPLFKDTHG